MPALAGAPRQVASPLSGRAYVSQPQWSTDGTELAFTASDKIGPVVENVSLETDESRTLALPGRLGNRRFDLSWSPDGRYFAYVEAIDRAGEVTQIRALRVADEESFLVTDGRTKDWSPNWSQDGRALYFVSNRGGSMDLWMRPIAAEGRPIGEPQQLTTGIGMQQATFSPDGRKLIYSRGGPQFNIWRVPVLSDRPSSWADAQQLTFEQAFIQHLDVSTEGQWFLFSSDRSGNQDLWKISAGGGEIQQITTNPTPDWWPRLSPDGKQIAFYAYRSGNRDIWVMPVDGGPARQLTDQEAVDAFPAWSPDGRMLAFASGRSGNQDIWVVPAEGGEAKQLTEHPDFDSYPEWSLDGEWVYFESNRTGESRVWRTPAEGGEPEPVTRGPASTPRASLDGKRILFLRSRSIWAVSLEDKTEYPVLDHEGRLGNWGGNLATDGMYLDFPWGRNLTDLWVMDVVRE